jgi:hypothetical protein
VIPANLLPEPYRQSFCIAGGYAACPALAKDQDVWVYGIPTAQLSAVRQELLVHLSQQTVSPRSRRAFSVYPAEDTRTAESYCQEFIQIKKVAADIYRPGAGHHQKQIHLMVTDAQNPGAILEGFDISTHQVALGPGGEVWTGGGYTAPPCLPGRVEG